MPPDKRRAPPAGNGSAPQEIIALGSGDGVQSTDRDPFAQPDRLLAEWLATPGLNSKQRRQIEDLGVTREAVHRAGGLGWARVATTGRLYMPSSAGDVAIIMPVWAGPAPSIYEAVEHPRLADLLAWDPEEPRRWRYRQGAPGPVLGAGNLGLAHSEGWPITFELTPLAWLVAGCLGAVLLDICEGHWRAEDEAEDGAHAAAWWGGEAA